MIERKICQIIDRTPNLIRILDHMPEPCKRHNIIKHLGIRYGDDDDERIYVFVPHNWEDSEHNIIT